MGVSHIEAAQIMQGTMLDTNHKAFSFFCLFCADIWGLKIIKLIFPILTRLVKYVGLTLKRLVV